MSLILFFSFAVAIACAAVAWHFWSAERRRSAARVAALASAAAAGDEAADSTHVVPVATLFEAPRTAAGSSRQVAQVATVAILAVALAGVTYALRGTGREAAALQPPASSQDVPLELMSMRHVRRDGGLTVAGLVRNPVHGAPLTRVDAVVFAFDRSGEFAASAIAALDLATLQPGEESSFAVTLRDVADVGRYRVSFRTDQTLLRHVDRRGDRQQTVVQR